MEDDALYEDVSDARGQYEFGATGNDVPSSPRWFENVTDYTEYDEVIII